MEEDAVSKTIDIYEKFADEYTNLYFDFSGICDMAEFFRGNLDGKRILDVGCGPGREARFFSENGFDVTGIDLTEKFLEIAFQKAPKAQFIKMDMRCLEFPDKNFDGVWVNASFLHIPKNEAEKTLLELKRVLKEGGLLHISVVAGEGEIFCTGGPEKGKGRFYALYGEDEFKNLLESNSFKIVKLKFVEHDERRWINIVAKKSS